MKESDDELKDNKVDFIVDKSFKIERIEKVVSKSIELKKTNKKT